MVVVIGATAAAVVVVMSAAVVVELSAARARVRGRRVKRLKLRTFIVGVLIDVVKNVVEQELFEGWPENSISILAWLMVWKTRTVVPAGVRSSIWGFHGPSWNGLRD